MAKDANETDAPTRREYVKYGAVLTGGLLSGCAGNAPTDSESTMTETNTETANQSGSSGNSETETDATNPYTVSMAPMGEVEFERVPESIFTRLTHLAGMAFALGRGDDVNAMHAPGYYDALWNQFTPRLPGVTLDWKGLYSSWEPSKEKLYELDSDVHLADPAGVSALDSWNADDVEAIGENIAPWFGNYYSDRHATPPEAWADDYQYYDLWEMFERVAQVFREEARYEALAEVHRRLVETVQEELPPVEERPTAVLIGPSDLEKIYAYKLDTPGFLTAHTRAAGAVGAFGDNVQSGSTVDAETLLDANPDVIFALGGMHPKTSMADIRDGLGGNNVTREVAAVKNDRVYAQGARYQGPILNLFQIEMTAKQLYPDQFGAWPTYAEGPYPEIPEDERLFDRERVASIIRGNF
ncbi:ABC transporter substrate-binding protein [Halogeometricum borinquense]|uniref:ABC transporter substrate-binding protein n=1 Tax=Halogeometricum borinquense TaxID=60847 RepID=A0A6C0UG10_9EURY|nr:ABC transporter substrate-binding protein [Halogeometricum borinquense]QIB74402.1 ABC transporter substrate-binding protein [Halogeometricum borinquense]